MLKRVPSANAYQVEVGETLGEIKDGLAELLAAAQEDQIGTHIIQFKSIKDDTKYELTLWGTVY